jgi:uncharacterized protein (TIGR03437 family)
MRLFLILLGGSIATVCFGQPGIGSVVNSASYANTTIAQGSIFTMFGFQLGPAQLVQANTYPLPLQLAGISVHVNVGGKTVNCPMIHVSDAQAAAILPSNTPLGDGTVTASSNGTLGFGMPITVTASAFGIYTTASSGIGPGIFTGVDYLVKTFNTPAHPGEVLIAWGTGFGPIDTSDAAVPANTKQFPNVDVLVGGVPAAISYAGRSGCCAGLDQIAFVAPSSVTGCFVPITVRTGATTVSNFATIPIAPAGQSCFRAGGAILLRGRQPQGFVYYSQLCALRHARGHIPERLSLHCRASVFESHLDSRRGPGILHRCEQRLFVGRISIVL